MKTKQKDVHYCDFCNKKTFQKKAMERHEEECYANPANKRDCFTCVFLGKKETNYIKVVPRWSHNAGNIEMYGSAEEQKAFGFFCKKKQIEIYPPKLQHTADRKGFEIGDDKKPMPLECEDFEKNNNLPF